MGRSRKKLSDQPFEIEVESLDAKGLGLAEHEGKTLKVYDALPGERVRARYLFGRGFRGKAETLDVLRPTGDRVEARCPHFGVCSACSLQHLSVAAQLDHKLAALLMQLREIGKVEPGVVYPPLDGPAWNYRRKARLSVRDVRGKERVLVGFRERNGRFVADMDQCHILRDEVAGLLPVLADLLGGMEGKAEIPQIEVACGDGQCALIFRHLAEISTADQQRLCEFSALHGVGLYLQPGGPETVHLLAPDGFRLTYCIEDPALRFEFEPLDFLQVNGGLNQKMITRALELLEPQTSENVLDLFCGLGNFTLPLATRAASVTGVEGSEKMVERARENAVLNSIENVVFHDADLYLGVGKQSPWQAAKFDKVLLDPPRTGASELLPWIAACGAGKVLYISCNPETLARDAGVLVHTLGFRLSGAGIMNMFPHTPHSEAIALFERVDGITQ
ncbi:MAG: 23S rRNA (uracil(1939)-C(5))-methyltransferase RlmD [Xanthomonadales bacterium]|nr:23S rRNA (uracil(1939)-C(5))-methyltransferase RlmD [Xanthomonadales bacterium]